MNETPRSNSGTTGTGSGSTAPASLSSSEHAKELAGRWVPWLWGGVAVLWAIIVTIILLNQSVSLARRGPALEYIICENNHSKDLRELQGRHEPGREGSRAEGHLQPA